MLHGPNQRMPALLDFNRIVKKPVHFPVDWCAGSRLARPLAVCTLDDAACFCIARSGHMKQRRSLRPSVEPAAEVDLMLTDEAADLYATTSRSSTQR
jgi:hypothetical protein